MPKSALLGSNPAPKERPDNGLPAPFLAIGPVASLVVSNAIRRSSMTRHHQNSEAA